MWHAARDLEDTCQLVLQSLHTILPLEIWSMCLDERERGVLLLSYEEGYGMTPTSPLDFLHLSPPLELCWSANSICIGFEGTPVGIVPAAPLSAVCH